MRSRTFLLVGVVILAVIPFSFLNAVSIAPVGATTATTGVTLPCAFSQGLDDTIGTQGQLAVDPTTKEVFVSCTNSDNVTVLNASGGIIQTLTGLGGASGLTIHNGIVYLALSTAGTIDTIDISTLKVTALATGLGSPTSVVYANGSLWTMKGGFLDQINPTSGTVVSYPLNGAFCFLTCTEMVGDPSNPDVLYNWEPGLSPATINRIDVSSTPKVTTSVNGVTLDNVHDLAVAADGGTVVPAGAAPYKFVELDATSLTTTGVVYPGSAYPTAVAMTGANGGLFAGGTLGNMGASVYVYGLHDPSKVVLNASIGKVLDFTQILPREMAFNPSGSTLYAVSADSTPDGQDTVFNIFHLAAGGYDLAGSDGGVFVFPTGQSSGFFGSLPTLGVKVSDVVGMVPTNNFSGYNLVGSDGGVFVFPTHQSTGYFGSLPGLGVKVSDVVGIVPTNNYTGYDLVGSDGGVFVFPTHQTSGFYGSLPSKGVHIHNIVGIVSPPDGGGYFLVGSDGGVFTFGNAPFLGSLPGIGIHVNNITGIASTQDGQGYYVVGSDGSVYAFGDATSYGSLPAIGVTVSNIVSLVPTPSGDGYWLIGKDGGVFAFGDAVSRGSLPGLGVNVANIVGAVPTS